MKKWELGKKKNVTECEPPIEKEETLFKLDTLLERVKNDGNTQYVEQIQEIREIANARISSLTSYIKKVLITLGYTSNTY